MSRHITVLSVAVLALALAACSSSSNTARKRAPAFPVGSLGLPPDISADHVNSFICANDMQFSIAFVDWGILFTYGEGVIPMRLSGSAEGVRYEGGHFVVTTSANRAKVYKDNALAMDECWSIE